MKKIAVGLMFIIAFAACKKDYTCTCKNPGGTADVKVFEKTKKKAAQQQCTAYYNEKYGNIAFNETICEIDD